MEVLSQNGSVRFRLTINKLGVKSTLKSTMFLALVSDQPRAVLASPHLFSPVSLSARDRRKLGPRAVCSDWHKDRFSRFLVRFLIEH